MSDERERPWTSRTRLHETVTREMLHAAPRSTTLHVMQSHDTFLYTLAVVCCVAAVVTVLCQRVRLPVVFGYLLAGMLVGPHVPFPLVANIATVNALAELGVVFVAVHPCGERREHLGPIE